MAETSSLYNVFIDNIDWLCATLVVVSEILKGLRKRRLFILSWYIGISNCLFFTLMAIHDKRPGVIVLNILLVIIFSRHIMYWSERFKSDKIVDVPEDGINGKKDDVSEDC